MKENIPDKKEKGWKSTSSTKSYNKKNTNKNMNQIIKGTNNIMKP